MSTQSELELLHTRLRMVRESKRLTLSEASHLSKGQISAIALGSYERGDRAISAAKLLQIAAMYGLPVTELFTAPEKAVSHSRVTLDLRKLRTSHDQIRDRVSAVIKNISRMRSDWNGEVISIRNDDLENLRTFAGFSVEEIEHIVREYSIPRVK